MENTVKITFIGDIMCERPLQLAYEKYGSGVLEHVFENTAELFSTSNTVIGNLETVFGGGAHYTRELYRFNTPDAFAAAMRRGGIDTVTTATNHCLDADIAGLCRTDDVLDRTGIEHTGTYRTENENRILIKNIGGRKISVLNYTYGTNTHETGVLLGENDLFRVGLLKPQTLHCQTVEGKRAGKLRRAFSEKLAEVLDEEERIKLKRLLGMKYNTVRTDHLDPTELDDAYTARILDELRTARECSDIVIACLHCGGQFNAVPGELSRYAVKLFAENGADAVICNHAHVVQYAEKIGSTFVAYCLGNYSISPSSIYVLHDNKPEFSVAVHLYIGSAGIENVTFSILKIEEEQNGRLTVYPVDKLVSLLPACKGQELIKDAAFIYHRFTGLAWNGSVLPEEFPFPGAD